MSRKAGTDPAKLATDAMMLWAESWFVIAARSWMIMSGDPRAQREASRMVEEKMRAAAELSFMAMTGSLGTGDKAVERTIKHVGKTVSANRRRLSKGK
ncbi:hypothetical protein [Croceicoccus sediminis]|uniref:hypothetical protein n=1 Tax=Croceicoccus sediminis TaxID=2571150 RepID=UPI001181E5B4|nr:hypothetical protein [Croceicoccus sediminis]